jgi:hypothetical protein
VITPDVWKLLKHFAPDARANRYPVAGGTLDQANQLIECCRLAWELEDQFRASRFSSLLK